MAEEREMYELVCKKEFDGLHKKQDEVLRLLRGYNDKQGLVDRVRWLDKVYKSITAIVVFLITVVVIQGVAWLFGKL